jgi:hypothetical protein
MNTSISPPVSADFIEKNVPAYRESQGIPGPFISSILYTLIDCCGQVRDPGNEQSPLRKKKEGEPMFSLLVTGFLMMQY